MLLKKRKGIIKIKREDKKPFKHGERDLKDEFSSESSFSKNSSKIEQSSTRLNRKRKFNEFAANIENPETDEQILKKIRQGDKSIFLINKDVKSEIKSQASNKKNSIKDTVVRFKNRILI